MKSFTVVFRSIDRFSLENTAVISINDSENLCEPSPILAPLGEILCEPRRLWRHGSCAPACCSLCNAYWMSLVHWCCWSGDSNSHILVCVRQAIQLFICFLSSSNCAASYRDRSVAPKSLAIVSFFRFLGHPVLFLFPEIILLPILAAYWPLSDVNSLSFVSLWCLPTFFVLFVV